jgi:hypothetical protein
MEFRDRLAMLGDREEGRHARRPDVDRRTTMAQPDVGDQVSWNTPQGRTHGTVVEVRVKDFQLAGQHFTASAESPMFVVESDKSGKRAAHRGEALAVRS